MILPVYRGAILPVPVRPPTYQGAPVVAYARRLVVYMAESPLGVCYHRVAPKADGTPGDAQHWNHETGGWENEFDPTKHVRPMDRPILDARPNYQCFAPPLDVTEDEAAFATIHTLRQDGTIASDLDMLTGPHLRTLAGGSVSTP